jgi:uncharacterized protein
VEIEKVMTVAAPAARVWDMLLDPNVMGACVPGMKSIEVVSPTEYLAVMHVKISFISAKFKLRTVVVEQHAPHYLRSEGTGEDASVASSLKQQSEIFLTELPDGRTELKMKVKVDVLGRLGSFGLSVMKTKADRMWEEFGQNLLARLEGTGAAATTGGDAATALAPATPDAAAPAAAVARAAEPAADAGPSPGPTLTTSLVDAHAALGAQAPQGWLSRLLARGRETPGAGRCIRIEVRRADATVTVHWPLEAADECAALLRDCLR